MNKAKIAGISAGVILIVAVLGWVSTAPYLSNQGLGRMPGVFIGGESTEPLEDFSVLNGQIQGPLMMKLEGFPPFVNYLSWVGAPDGVITATRPDNGYWERRVKADGGNGWLRIGDATYPLRAVAIDGEERLDMMAQWAAKAGRTLDEPLYEGSEPLRDWKVFLWVPRS